MKALKKIIREELYKILSENSAEKLYKIEGLLVTDFAKKTQTQVFSDIRSITGITTMDTEEYTPNLPKQRYSYNKVTINIDPYPYLKNGQFNIETVKMIIKNINHIKGVVTFKAEPQLVNVGI